MKSFRNEDDFQTRTGGNEPVTSGTVGHDDSCTAGVNGVQEKLGRLRI
jgi:hypothetical protein